MPVNGKKGNHIMGDGKGVLKLKKKKHTQKTQFVHFHYMEAKWNRWPGGVESNHDRVSLIAAWRISKEPLRM